MLLDVSARVRAAADAHHPQELVDVCKAMGVGGDTTLGGQKPTRHWGGGGRCGTLPSEEYPVRPPNITST